MKNNKYEFFELVDRGHPDKLADWIADCFCNEVLQNDKNAKVACEVLGCGSKIFVGGEIKTNLSLDKIVEIQEYVEMMYRDETNHFSAFFYWQMQQQYQNITALVEKKNGAIGAGDQGICIGYACDETVEMLPLIQVIAHKIFNKIEWTNTSPIRGDSDCEHWFVDRNLLLTMENKKLKHLIFASQNDVGDRNFVEKKLQIVLNELKKEGVPFTNDFKYEISNVWKIGGFKSDTGLTGRKIACDNFANCPNGGGAFSGKDWTKVDRTGTYYARYLAKNILAKNPKLKEVVVKLIYKIGDEYPKVYVNGKLNNKIKTMKLKDVIEKFRHVNLHWLTNNHWHQELGEWEQIDEKCEELKDYE